MISLETAKKLKEAGLEWEPQEGDAYHDSASDTIYYSQYPPLESANYIRFTWLARLDQLLAEIEKWGYSWEMRTVIDESQSVRFNAKNIAYWIHVWKTGHIEWEDGFKRAFTSPSNAAASALLWIYEGRAKA